MENKYLLSIVIPTRNRYKYLLELIELFDNYFPSNVELVIQDNSDNNQDIVNKIEGLNSSNINYYYDINEIYSQTENSDLAIDKSQGKYVCYIGDDDLISTKIVDLCKWLDLNNIDSCYGPIARYYWDDVEFKFLKYPYFTIPKIKKGYKTLDVNNELDKVIKKGAISIGKLPRVYQGIVSRNLLHKIKNKFGTYFPGSSPDMANAVATSLIKQKFVYINFPVIVSGSGYNSASGKGLRGEHKAQIKDVDQLPKDIINNWNKKIPFIWVSDTIWCQSCYEALNKVDDIRKIKKINYEYLYAHMKVFFPDCKDKIEHCSTNSLREKYYIFCIFMYRGFNFIKNTLKTQLKIDLECNKLYYKPLSLEKALMELDNLLNVDFLLK